MRFFGEDFSICGLSMWFVLPRMETAATWTAAESTAGGTYPTSLSATSALEWSFCLTEIDHLAG